MFEQVDIFSCERQTTFFRCLEASVNLLIKREQVRSSFCYAAVGGEGEKSVILFLALFDLYNNV